LLYEFPTISPLFLEQQFGSQVKFVLLWDSFFAHCICGDFDLWWFPPQKSPQAVKITT
jgi:hypothetical protein